ncbi:conserved hypothetical protein [Streptomyces sviceus ATCC 29083]|uniref:Uncharacterized protein n=1 Tax=Streptomyces sviceus (strain ATCC 29083 / DSM 924 / JCM 4929 / NBRC 13980 / NCIMB 11184 / NRRL 5439 / UC 5370) TaxID=463191 RepID=B5I5Z3_STRX2|nr:conserved hypothetical protein [Streptomyces sviceus ATCC 29083]
MAGARRRTLKARLLSSVIVGRSGVKKAYDPMPRGVGGKQCVHVTPPACQPPRAELHLIGTVPSRS